MSTDTKEAISGKAAEKQRWEEETLEKVLDKTPERKKSFEGVSLEPVERLYTESDIDGIDILQTRHSSDGLSWQALDDASVRRLFVA